MYNTKFYLREKKFCDEISTTPNEMIKNMLQNVEDIGMLHIENQGN